MNTRQHVLDMADLALHRSQFDCRLGGEERRGRIIAIEYCQSQVLSRVADGKSHDCDEWRVILKFAGKAH